MSFFSPLEEKRALVIGGLASSLVNFRWPLISGLASHGYTVYGCAAEDDAAVKKHFREIGGDYFSIPLARSGLNPVKDLHSHFAIKSLIQQLSPKIVVAYTIKPIVYGLPAAQSLGVPYSYALITGLGYAFTSTASGLKRKAVSLLARGLYTRALRKATHVFFQNIDDQSLFIERRLIKQNTSTSVVNGSGVNIQHYSPEPLPNENRFLLIARLVADKGIREYVEAARLIHKKYPKAEFFLAGPLDPNPSAISRKELDSWCKDGTIQYVGPQDDVRTVLRSSRIYVLPSYREGTPRTVLEAMAMGRPIITTDAPGCRDTVIPNFNGLLVPPQNVTALAQAMEEAILHAKNWEQFGKNSRTLVEEKYDAEKVKQQMLNVIR